MNAERGRPSDQTTVGPTTPGNENTAFYNGHADGAALDGDYGANVGSLDTSALGSVLSPIVPGATRKSMLQSNTGGQLEANNILEVANVFAYDMLPDDHHPEKDWASFAARFHRYDGHTMRLLDQHPETYMIVTTASGLAAAVSTEGRIGLIKSVEGMPQVIDVPLRDAAETLARVGTQIVNPMWNYSTDIGDAHPSSQDTGRGLTPHGIGFIQACADRGIPVFDVSHASEKTALDMIRLVGPNRQVIASHTGARIKGDPSDKSRNISDKVAQAIFERNGIVGVALAGGMLGRDLNDPNSKPATLEHVVRAIRHFVNLDPTGGKLVTLGPDFNGLGIESRVEGAATVLDMENVAEALRRDGFSQSEIEDIFWRNAYDLWHRALTDATKAA